MSVLISFLSHVLPSSLFFSSIHLPSSYNTRSQRRNTYLFTMGKLMFVFYGERLKWGHVVHLSQTVFWSERWLTITFCLRMTDTRGFVSNFDIDSEGIVTDVQAIHQNCKCSTVEGFSLGQGFSILHLIAKSLKKTKWMTSLQCWVALVLSGLWYASLKLGWKWIFCNIST